MSQQLLGDDWVVLDDFAAQVKRHPRTVRRWMAEADGFPFSVMGNITAISIPLAKNWLLKRSQQKNPRRKPAAKPKHRAA